MTLTQKIKESLQASFKDAYIEVLDPQCDNTHLEAIVVSDYFEGKSLLQQHRSVMNLLKEAFDSDLHALKLNTYTFQTWNQQNKEPLCQK